MDAVFSTLLVTGLGGVFIYTLASGITTIIGNDVYFDRPVDIARAFKQVAGHFVALILSLIVVWLLASVGLMFFIIPGLYLFAKWFAVKQVILLENGDTGAALSRSSYLSKGMKRHIINTFGIVVLISIAVSFGSSMMGGLFN